MSKNIIKAPKGTQDLIGADCYTWRLIENILEQVSYLFGYLEIRTPMFEQLHLFSRSVGNTTDVVQKEMYQVSAQKSSDVFALKPEGTAATVRSLLEHQLLQGVLPLKLFYLTPCFRHERPQAGRLRQFHQYGVELFGTKSPVADLELIMLANEIFKALEIKNLTLHINSIGCKQCRPGYYQALRAYFETQETLCPLCLDRMDKNPMRILDCKNEQCASIAKGAPKALDYLCEECDTHFKEVKALLGSAGIAYDFNPKLVRGLDYYTKTVFEFMSSDLGAQSTVLGGGRYDALVEQMGGPDTPALGFAMGLERVLLVRKAQQVNEPKPAGCKIFIGSMGALATTQAVFLVSALRQRGVVAVCDLMGRSVKAQMKYADKIGAEYAMILGEQELASARAQLKNMATGIEQSVDLSSEWMDNLVI